jgi:hypothetical protein
MKNKNDKKLSLSKTTVKNLSVRSDVHAGGIVLPPFSVTGACHYPPQTVHNCLI